MKTNEHFIAQVVFILIFSGSLAAGCGVSRKAMKTKAEKAITSPVSNTSFFRKMILSNLQNNYIDFHTFSARIKLDITTNQASQKGINAFVRMQKDSVIWISVRPFLGIELERILITPDSVKLINYLKKTVYLQKADSLQQLLDISFDFATLQNILIGNPVFITGSLQNIERDSATIRFSCKQKNLLASYVLSAGSFLLEESRLRDQASQRSSHQQYGQYALFSGRSFALERKLSVQTGSVVNAMLRFSQVEFDRPLRFPFTYSDQFDVQ